MIVISEKGSELLLSPRPVPGFSVLCSVQTPEGAVTWIRRYGLGRPISVIDMPDPRRSAKMPRPHASRTEPGPVGMKMGRSGADNSFFGRKHTPQTKIKMSVALAKMKRPFTWVMDPQGKAHRVFPDYVLPEGWAWGRGRLYRSCWRKD